MTTKMMMMMMRDALTFGVTTVSNRSSRHEYKGLTYKYIIYHYIVRLLVFIGHDFFFYLAVPIPAEKRTFRTVCRDVQMSIFRILPGRESLFTSPFF